MKGDTTRSVLNIASRVFPGRRQRVYRLPDELVDRSITHLVRIAMGFGGVVLIALLVNIAMALAGSELLAVNGERTPLPTIPTIARIIFVIASGGMVFAGLSKTLDRKTRSDIGLVYEVLCAGMVAITERMMLPMMDIPVGAISAVAIWIFLMRVVAPTSTGRAAVAALLSATTVPIAAIAAAVTSSQPPLAYLALSTVLTTYGAATLGGLASRMIYQLGTAVTEAREMGSYQLETRLGSGGMGEVWLGRHRLLQRPAAIKLIRPGTPDALSPLDDQEQLARFELEARATAKLSSIHTIKLFDFGITRDGSFYYVMELLDGLDLDTLVHSHGPLPAERAIFVLVQICQSLAEAHSQGFIHRDMKPANVFLCRLGLDHDFVKVLDFGLVRDTAEGASSTLSQDGLIAGTPAFIAPEIILQDAPIGPATDIYMLGCVAYWLISGRLVFEGTNSMAMVKRHVLDEPAPPSTRTDLPIPADLDNVILHCLAKNPQDRPQSALSLARRLEEIALPQPWTSRKARSWWDAHRPVKTTP